MPTLWWRWVRALNRGGFQRDSPAYEVSKSMDFLNYSIGYNCGRFNYSIQWFTHLGQRPYLGNHIKIIYKYGR
jgi:hypothetical protein